MTRDVVRHLLLISNSTQPGQGYLKHCADEAAYPVAAVRAADAIFVGGGNTFRLLDRMYALVDAIRDQSTPGPATWASSAWRCIHLITQHPVRNLVYTTLAADLPVDRRIGQ